MSNEDVNTSRRRFLVAATSVVGGVGVVGAAVPFISAWNPSERAKAAGAPVKIDVSKLEVGAMITEAWRGKPVFVVRRDPEMMGSLEQVTERLRDPGSDESEQPEYAKNLHRSRREDILVLVGVCTHLGCSPKFHPEIKPEPFDAEWKGGFFCPCHGSKFDLAGRVLQNVPAPTNLVVPPYSFEGDGNVLIIGVDEENA